MTYPLEDLLDDIEEICGAVEIAPGKQPLSFTFAGETVEVGTPWQILERLSEVLYVNGYLRRWDGSGEPDLTPVPAQTFPTYASRSPGRPVDNARSQANRLRFTLNVGEAGPQIAAQLSPRLERFQMPYQVEIRHGERPDGLVLAVLQNHVHLALRLVQEAIQNVELGEEVPLFTRPLAPGLGLVEDPGAPFGRQRCRIFAEGLLAAQALGKAETIGGQVDELRAQFQRYGLNLDTPYLNAHSVDIYTLPQLENGP